MSMTDVSFVAPGSDSEVESNPVVEKTLEIWASRGWTRIDKAGHVVADDLKGKTFVYEWFRDHAVVNSDSDILDDGLSAADLYAKTFPSTPGARGLVEDEIEFEAYKTVERKLWQWTSTGVKAYCQETAEMEGLDVVMVEKKVFRPTRDGATGTGAPRAVVVRFFTSNPDLIFTLSAQPATAKLVKAAEETARHLRMNTARHPELAPRIAKETQSALKRSSATLAQVTHANTAAAITGAGDAD